MKKPKLKGNPIGSVTPNLNPCDRLTAREKHICACLVLDLADKQIAAELRISVGTVRSHIDAIRQKLQAQSRLGIAILWDRSCRQAIDSAFVRI